MNLPANHIRFSATLFLVGALAAASLSSGCSGAARSRSASDPDTSARWVRWSEPVFATINREAFYSLAHSEARSTLVFDQTDDAGRPVSPARTWIISMPDTPRMYSPIDVDQDADSRAWLLTSVRGHVSAPLHVRGRISVLSSDADSLTAQVNLISDIDPATAGFAGPREATLDARIVFTRVTPYTPQPRSHPSTSGVDSPAPKKK